MMDVISRMKDTCGSMRCFLKGPSSSPLVQFCSQPGGVDDNGDGGGVPVFTFLSITCFENLANELVQMFILELSLKRLLVVEHLSVNCEEPPQGQTGQLTWSNELYPGEFDDLCSIDLYSERNCGPLSPRLEGWEFGKHICKQSNHLPDREVLQMDVVSRMKDTCGSMRCFLKGPSGSPLVQFCSQPGGVDDSGDGGGVPVFTFLSITCFENLANELVQMFILELSLKRLLVVELLSVNCEEPPQGQTGQLTWSDELYPGEFDDLCSIDLYSERNCGPLSPRLEGWEFGKHICKQSNHLPDREVLQVYLTAWLVEVNIDMSRVDQIFGVLSEEMHVSFA